MFILEARAAASLHIRLHLRTFSLQDREFQEVSREEITLRPLCYSCGRKVKDWVWVESRKTPPKETADGH